MRRHLWRFLLLTGCVLGGTIGVSADPNPKTPSAAAGAQAPATAPSVEARRSLAAAAKWLWSQQAADGGWHSRTYGLLESGQAMTPMVLDALSGVPEDVHSPTREQRQRALDFIRKHVSNKGVIGLDDPEVPEYPNYATALALKCLLKWGDASDAAAILRMCEYLVAEQYCEARGFKRDNLAYGGWGFGGPLPLGGSPGHMDIAHTRHVLEALRASTSTVLNALTEVK